MAYISEENKRKTMRVVEDVREFAVLTDDPDPSSREKVVPGIGFHEDAEKLRDICKDLEEGVFKTLVMGKFKNGKSTFINAIVGKLMMAARASACTAVIATVELGDDTDTVDVFYTDRPPRKMSLEQFTDEFQISKAEEDRIMAEGKLDRFSNVDHVEMRSQDELFEGGVKLIDSPGLEEAYARTKATFEFVPKANAIIFTLSAISLFSSAEKEYIAENFAGRHLRNIFFVVNRVDNLNEGQLDASVKPTVRAALEDVFTDKNGIFDEELYNNRVFFTSAYPALCAKTGVPYTIMIGNRKVEVPFPLEETGMPEFEAALKRFLNSDERIRAAYSSTLTQIANIHRKVEKKVSADIAARSQSAEEREKNAKAAKKKLEEAKKDVADIRSKAKRAAGLIADRIYVDLMSYVGNDIPREFSVLVEDGAMQQKFGMGGLLTLSSTFIASRIPIPDVRLWAAEKQKHLMAPFANAINKYILEKLQQEWPKRIPALTRQDVKDLMEDINQEAEEFSLKLDEAINLFAYGNAKAPAQEKGNAIKATIQSIVAAMNVDVSVMVDATGQGGMPWGDFLKEVVIQVVLLDSLINVVVAVLGDVFFWPAVIAFELLQMKRHGDKTGKKLLVSIADAGFARLSEEISTKEMDIKKKVADQIIAECEKSARVAEAYMNEQLNAMNRILKENAEDKAAANAENIRITAVRDRMKELIEDVFELLNGHKPTEKEFASLSGSMTTT